LGDPVETAEEADAEFEGDEERIELGMAEDPLITPPLVIGGVAEPGKGGIGDPAQLLTLPVEDVG